MDVRPPRATTSFLGGGGGTMQREWQELKRFFRYLRPHWRSCLHLGFWVALVALLRLPIPLLTKYLIDHIIPARDLSMLNLLGVALLSFYVFNYLANLLKGYLLVVLKEKVIYRLQLRLFGHILALPSGFLQNQNTGYLVSRLANDSVKIEGLLSSGVFELLLDILTFVFGLIAMSVFHYKMTLLCLTLLPFYLASLLGFGRRVKLSSAAVQETVGRMLGNLQESLSGIFVVRSFNRGKRELIKHSHFARQAIRARLRQAGLLLLSTGTTALIGGMAPLIVLWYGGSQVIQGALTLGEMVAFMSFLNYIFGPTQKMVNVALTMKDAMAALERVFELLDREPWIRESPTSRTLRDVQGVVTFENVSFSYEGRAEVLKNVNFEVRAGEIITVAGKSGAGKSTLFMLLLRFFDPSAGRILIDGVDIRQLSVRSLLTIVAPVFQDNFLFDGTVYENIRYGRIHADADDVREAAIAANAHEFIMGLPEGYDTRVGERGVKLSGGQKQRIAIARAILKGSRILILDEATAFLDAESERLIQEVLLALKNDHTIFVVAHKPSTVRLADRILVIEEGRIVEKDPREVSRQEESYQAFFAEQAHSCEPQRAAG